MSDAKPVPENVVQMVDTYVDNELRDAQQYENSKPLDESGIWSLHRLAGEIYALGFDAGGRVEALRNRAERQRQRDFGGDS